MTKSTFGRFARWAIAAALAVAALAAAPAPVQAHGLNVGFADDSFFLASPSTRSFLFDQLVADRAQILRIDVRWRNVTNPRRAPAHPTDPADPNYYWSRTDAVVNAAAARHIPILMTVLDAPDWAEGKNRPSGSAVPPGAWKPNASALGKFAQALAKRYSGHYHGLPRVRYFEVWNEPNITKFLAPQWQGKRAVSPGLYRRMLNNFYAGVKRVQPGAKVIGGAMSPFGDSRRHPLDPARPRLRPLVFLRKLLCLKHNLKPSKCPNKPRLDILSQHPLNFNKPPSYHPHNRNDVQVATFSSVRRVLRAAERAKHVRPHGHHPLWATEYSWYTPPNPTGVSPMTQAKWVEQGFYLLWKQGASAVINYPFRDDPRIEPISRWATSGALYHDGSRKPSFQSFRFPFVAHHHSKAKVGVWGKAPLGGRLQIQRKRNGHWQTKATVKVHPGQIFTRSLRLRGHPQLRGKVGGLTSLPWSPH
ncbi:MAG: hypothetical protein ACJ75I_07590 [Solirubrobacterales bacterium]